MKLSKNFNSIRSEVLIADLLYFGVNIASRIARLGEYKHSEAIFLTMYTVSESKVVFLIWPRQREICKLNLI